ncbi:hypothetical protein [Novosphingobium taihuense]|uniref:Preprotein translocase subunit YajC n=1 Tax=Novosphingobium taihuense TaxID=260085 RepID=A0A7W7AEE9_9SPHN|nr:hypothetical protein [Novosphingobium taihuense]MBB4615341.1 preprotein translocase subunit YajC [Novosphingobium taihuense]TWH84376.1 hypothetical protein IQ25_02804 [Novosphingobium taihuense]
MRVISLVLAATAALSLPSAASAQATATASSTPNLTVGSVIYDPQGGEVGKIDSVTGDAIVVDTGAHKATLPRTAFGIGAKGPMVTITKAQIDEQVAAVAQKAAAALEAALVVGAEVKGKAGTPIGTLKEVSADKVVIDRTAGPVALARNAVGLGPQGLFISLTAEELDAAAKPNPAAN